jgi:phage terminase small subunit
MKALTEKQRRFVVAWFVTGQREKAAHMAGYAGDEGTNLLEVSAHQVWHNARVQAAIIEYAKSALKGMVPIALHGLKTIMEDGGHKDRLKAISMTLNRTGLHETTEVQHVHTNETREEQLMRITEKARSLGLDPDKLLGGGRAFVTQPVPAGMTADVIDADYVDTTPTLEGLEDIV